MRLGPVSVFQIRLALEKQKVNGMALEDAQDIVDAVNALIGALGIHSWVLSCELDRTKELERPHSEDRRDESYRESDWKWCISLSRGNGSEKQHIKAYRRLERTLANATHRPAPTSRSGIVGLLVRLRLRSGG